MANTKIGFWNATPVLGDPLVIAPDGHEILRITRDGDIICANEADASEAAKVFLEALRALLTANPLY